MTHPLSIMMLSVHGLLRGRPELGRDGDTGGQVQYVVDLARSLGADEHGDRVERVDVITRRVGDPAVDASYREPEEQIAERAWIVRLPFGPERYVRKESLWPYLDELVDRCLMHVRRQQRLPDVIHSHYADAGYVGSQLSMLLGVPLVHTSHSLGRRKRERLLAAGRKEGAIERQFRFERRVRAEEQTLERASLVVASTHQEVREQYEGYERFDHRRAAVIPPGIDLSRFSPASRFADLREIAAVFDPFLADLHKPGLLTLSRPDRNKNINHLVAAFATTPGLRERANLLVVAGNRDDIRSADDEARAFYTDLLLDIDRFDLYGSVAMPKQHTSDQVPDIYRYVAKSRGLLVNPALTENFGLTLIEAAASGLPVVATDQGGPSEIVANCRNGLLIDSLPDPMADPLAEDGLGSALSAALSDRNQWRRWSRNGIAGASRHYTWPAHAATYLNALDKVTRRSRRSAPLRPAVQRTDFGSPLTLADALLVVDLDNTLIGDEPSMGKLLAWIAEHAGEVAFGVATGRTRASAVRLLRRHRVPLPDVLISSVGGEIAYGPRLIEDDAWRRHIAQHWNPDGLRDAIAALDGIHPQPAVNSTAFKLAYHIDARLAPATGEVNAALQRQGLRARLVVSHGKYLDVLPVRASKGRAVQHLARRWGFEQDRILVAGDSGNDADMLIGEPLGVVVAGHAPELARLRGARRIYFASSPFAGGILEAIEHYAFADPIGRPARPS